MRAQDYAVTSDAYIAIGRDTRDFLRGQEDAYVSFLHPVRYYDRKKENFLLTKDKAPELARLYDHFEEKLAQLPDTYSLTRVLDEHTQRLYQQLSRHIGGEADPRRRNRGTARTHQLR